jgi:hypothetical protein
MRSVSDKICCVCVGGGGGIFVQIFYPENGRTGEATDGNIIWRMRFACWITKATETRSEYEMLSDFLRQQWLRERASLLRCTYIASFVHVRLSDLSPLF